jgi:hypothetical protein
MRPSHLLPHATPVNGQTSHGPITRNTPMLNKLTILLVLLPCSLLLLRGVAIADHHPPCSPPTASMMRSVPTTCRAWTTRETRSTTPSRSRGPQEAASRRLRPPMVRSGRGTQATGATKTAVDRSGTSFIPMDRTTRRKGPPLLKPGVTTQAPRRTQEQTFEHAGGKATGSSLLGVFGQLPALQEPT